LAFLSLLGLAISGNKVPKNTSISYDYPQQQLGIQMDCNKPPTAKGIQLRPIVHFAPTNLLIARRDEVDPLQALLTKGV
jgi:hypothetical protein